MKHPRYDIRLFITSDGHSCPEFETVVGRSSLKCTIPSLCMSDWNYNWRVNPIQDLDIPRPFYRIEVYEDGIQVRRSIYIDRRKKSELEGSALLPARDITQKNSRYSLLEPTMNSKTKAESCIEIKVYESAYDYMDFQHFNNFSGDENYSRIPDIFLVLFEFSDKLKKDPSIQNTGPSNINISTGTLPKYQRTSSVRHTTPIMDRGPSTSSGFVGDLSALSLGESCSSTSPYRDHELSSAQGPLGLSTSQASPPLSPPDDVGHNKPRKGSRDGPDEFLNWLGKSRKYYPIPAGWETKFTASGVAYYANHDCQYTTWLHPLSTKLNRYRSSETQSSPGREQTSAADRVSPPPIDEGVLVVEKEEEENRGVNINADVGDGEAIPEDSLDGLREQRRQEWDALMAKRQYYTQKLGDINRTMEVLEHKREGVFKKVTEYQKGYEEMKSWIEKYFSLWFPLYVPTMTPGLFHEQMFTFVNRGNLIKAALKETEVLNAHINQLKETRKDVCKQILLEDDDTAEFFEDEFELIGLENVLADVEEDNKGYLGSFHRFVESDYPNTRELNTKNISELGHTNIVGANTLPFQEHDQSLGLDCLKVTLDIPIIMGASSSTNMREISGASDEDQSSNIPTTNHAN